MINQDPVLISQTMWSDLTFIYEDYVRVVMYNYDQPPGMIRIAAYGLETADVCIGVGQDYKTCMYRGWEIEKNYGMWEYVNYDMITGDGDPSWVCGMANSYEDCLEIIDDAIAELLADEKDDFNEGEFYNEGWELTLWEKHKKWTADFKARQV